MCTSFISNRKKTIVGWNLDLVNMEHRVRADETGVYIDINDDIEGWLPLFGANSRGDFVGMPTCWPFDDRSDPSGDAENETNVIMLDIDLLLQKKTLAEVRQIAENSKVCSVPGTTFMSALSDKNGDVLYIIPGQGNQYFERPKYKVLTNFSPFKGKEPRHPWMGWDRHQKAEKMLEDAGEDFDVDDAFEILKAVSQKLCPTVVSMVFDPAAGTVHWCENQEWNRIKIAHLSHI